MIVQLQEAAIDDLTDATVRGVWRMLEELRHSVIRSLLDATGKDNMLEVARLNTVLAQIDHAAQDFAQEAASRLSRDIARSWDAAEHFTGIPLPSLGAPALSTLAAAQQFSADLIKGLTFDMKEELTRRIRLAVLGGTSPTQLMRDTTTLLGSANALKAGQLKGFVAEGIAHRAEVITRTEMNRVFNDSSWQRIERSARDLPGLEKTWVTAGDGRVRESHRRLNGVTIPVDEDFMVDDRFPARGPHDPRLPAGEVIQCRCRLIASQPR